MPTVTIPKDEYVTLKRQATLYRRFASRIFEDVIQDPVGEVARDFKNTGLYTDEFLVDLEQGLRKSSYGKQHGSSPNQKGA